MQKLRPIALFALLTACSSAPEPAPAPAPIETSGREVDVDDPAVHVGALQDPERRDEAVQHLQRIHSQRLTDAAGDRTAAPMVAFRDAVAEPLGRAYTGATEATEGRVAMLVLIDEMRDPRTLPALLTALAWEGEPGEEAVVAARAIEHVEVSEERRGEVVAALCQSLVRIETGRGIDNRLRIGAIGSLGALGDRRATECLSQIALAQSEEQNFLINRLAAQQLGVLEDPRAVPTLIAGLFLFAPGNPAMRMNDVAAEGLVRIGRPSLEPLLQVLAGEHRQSNAIAERYIAAVRAVNEVAATHMSVRQTTSAEATNTLGTLGFVEAFEPLMAESRARDVFQRVNGTVALSRLNLEGAARTRVHQRMREVYARLPDDVVGIQARAHLISAMRQTFDVGFFDFFLAEAKKRDLHPAVRMEAVSSAARLAAADQARELSRWIAASTADDYQETFENETAQARATAIACDEDVSCYVGKLADPDRRVARKAAYMLGRLGDSNTEALDALVRTLSHSEIEVRLDALYAIDQIATDGSAAAVAAIDELQETEEGRAIWTQFSREALPVRARLRARSR